MTIGCRTFDFVRVLYPTDEPATPHTFGPYAIDLADDAPIAVTRPRLVVCSHGTGGTPWAFSGLATHLVRAGYVVALVEHPGNHRGDNSRANTVDLLAQRPRDVRFAIDRAHEAFELAPAVALIGHSLGGYTALALAGGKPTSLPSENPDRIGRPIAVEPDPRVRDVVLLAPALPWFMAPGALADVKARVFVRVGEHDEFVPPFVPAQILAGLTMDFAVVPGAGHFAFFFPVPGHLAQLPPGRDPPGFDRAAYQPRLYAEISAFLELQVQPEDRR